MRIRIDVHLLAGDGTPAMTRSHTLPGMTHIGDVARVLYDWLIGVLRDMREVAA